MLYHMGVSQHTQNIQIKHLKSLVPAQLCSSLGVQVPHKLSKSNLLDCISTCSSLHVMKSVPFLKQIVMGDEKQTLYNNVEWTRSWGTHNETSSTTLKSSLHLKKVMLYMWWNQKGVFYYKLLAENQTIKFQQVPLPVRPTESSTQRKASGISQQKIS